MTVYHDLLDFSPLFQNKNTKRYFFTKSKDVYVIDDEEGVQQERLWKPTGFEIHEEFKRILSSFKALHPDQKRIDLIGKNVFWLFY